MNGKMFRALLWKEWRESRLRFLALFCTFHLPLVFFYQAMRMLKGRQHDLFVFQIAAPRNMYATLFYQSAFNMTIGLFLIAFFAASAFSGEYEGNRLFFMFERPVRRGALLAVKWGVYMFEALVAICLSLFTSQLLVYLAYNADGSPVLAIPGEQLAEVLGACLRGAIWLAVLGAGAFGSSFLFAVVFPRWWTGMIAGTITVGTFLLFMYFRIYDWMFWAFTHQPGPAGPPIEKYARLEGGPLLWLLVPALLCYAASHHFLKRKEIR
ncbi:MAG: hypothetical protein EHM61_20025 [Acidobacteria bacterium]|nr:MAG: hypothetical protein EHM61_20025 [Acidobacteriota bacterium]